MKRKQRFHIRYKIFDKFEQNFKIPKIKSILIYSISTNKRRDISDGSANMTANEEVLFNSSQ